MGKVELEDVLEEELEDNGEILEFPIDRISIYEKNRLEYLFKNNSFGIKFKVKNELIMVDLFYDLIYRMWLN